MVKEGKQPNIISNFKQDTASTKSEVAKNVSVEKEDKGDMRKK